MCIRDRSKATLPPHESRYVALEGGWSKKPILREFPAITVGTYNVKLTANGQDTIVTVTLKDARTQAKIMLKEMCIRDRRTCVLVTLLSVFTIGNLGAGLTAQLNHPFFTLPVSYTHLWDLSCGSGLFPS